MKFIIHKGGKGSGNFSHGGRPGKVGGSTTRVHNQVDNYGQIPPANLGKAYMITGYDVLVDAKGDHYSYLQNPKARPHFGLGPSILTISGKDLQKVFDSGAIRVREFMDGSVWMMSLRIDTPTLRRLQRLVDEDKLHLQTNTNVWTDFDIESGNTTKLEFSYNEFMSAKYVHNGVLKDMYTLSTRKAAF